MKSTKQVSFFFFIKFSFFPDYWPPLRERQRSAAGESFVASVLQRVEADQRQHVDQARHIPRRRHPRHLQRGSWCGESNFLWFGIDSLMDGDFSIIIPEMKRGVLGVWENLGGRVLYICVLLHFYDQFFEVFWGGTWVAPLPLSPSM